MTRFPSKMPFRTFLLIASALPLAAAQGKTVVRQVAGGGAYDPVTIELDGPQLDEAAGPNPFADYILDVAFTDGAKTYTVPGYFLGCADPAKTGCTGGKLWRAHFIPDHGGAWKYTIRFRTGADIVAAGGEGQPVAGDGGTGQVTVADAARNAVRARGLLSYTGEPYYRWSGSKDVFFKFGADAPENFLADADFDATPNFNNLRKTWAPHLRDYNAAEAARFTWGNGKGKGILGALRYLRDAGLTTQSMLLFNVGGDDRNVVPQILRVSPEAYAALPPARQWSEGVWHDRYDLSKLAQWQHVLDYGDEIGLHFQFKLAETENDKFMDGGALGRERKIYLRQMMARFGHYLALTWNLGEENVQTTKDEKDEANFIGRLDPYGHPLVMHTHPDEHEFYRPLLGPATALNGASLQGGTTDFSDMRSDIIKWSSLSRAAGRPWVIGYDEQGSASGGAPVDDDYPADKLAQPMNEKVPTREVFRRGATWNAFTAGANGMEVYYGYRTGCTDLNCQDHRTRAKVWEDGVNALDFFRKYVGNDAVRMQADDDLTFPRNDYVFAELGKKYVIYLAMQGVTNPTGGTAPAPNARRSGVVLQMTGFPGRYSVDWYDAIKGGALRKGSVTEVAGDANANLGAPPANGSGEWAILVRRLP